jgi:hypothetical protein
MQSRLPMHRSPRCGAQMEREPLLITGDTNGRCRMHGGTSPGAPKGNKHAFRHGRYTGKAIASRREVAALIRAMKGLAAAVDADE